MAETQVQDTDCDETNVVVTEEPVVLDAIDDNSPYGEFTGSTKWFNDKLGFGFITICDGDRKGTDIFVHHSGIKPLNSNYKTLRKGEYIQFNIDQGKKGLQAIDVTGIKGGPLMCDNVTSKRIVNGVAVYSKPDEYQHHVPMQQGQQPNGWQTIPQRRPKLVYSGVPQMAEGGVTRPRQVNPRPQNVRDKSKYNKNKNVAPQ